MEQSNLESNLVRTRGFFKSISPLQSLAPTPLRYRCPTKKSDFPRSSNYLGPLHTRDWEPVTSTLQALSLVGKAEQVEVRFTLRLRHQQSMWMQDGCKSLHGFLHGITWICFMVAWIIFKKPPFGGRPNTKPGDHGTLNVHNRWFILFLSCATTHMNRNPVK